MEHLRLKEAAVGQAKEAAGHWQAGRQACTADRDGNLRGGRDSSLRRSFGDLVQPLSAFFLSRSWFIVTAILDTSGSEADTRLH